jgi:hypothetical protein
VVTDGSVAKAKEVVGGYWIIKTASKEEAIAWAKRCPALPGDVLEIRQIQEMEDFPEAVVDAARANAPTLMEKSGR